MAVVTRGACVSLLLLYARGRVLLAVGVGVGLAVADLVAKLGWFCQGPEAVAGVQFGAPAEKRPDKQRVSAGRSEPSQIP